MEFNLPNPISKKMMEKSDKEFKLIFQKCYLELQKAILHFEKKNPQSKEKCKEWRKRLESAYLETIKNL